MFKSDFPHKSAKTIYEIFSESLNDRQRNKVVLFIILNTHQTHFFSCLLHKTKKLLELQIVRFSYM